MGVITVQNNNVWGPLDAGAMAGGSGGPGGQAGGSSERKGSEWWGGGVSAGITNVAITYCVTAVRDLMFLSPQPSRLQQLSATSSFFRRNHLARGCRQSQSITASIAAHVLQQEASCLILAAHLAPSPLQLPHTGALVAAAGHNYKTITLLGVHHPPRQRRLSSR